MNHSQDRYYKSFTFENLISSKVGILSEFRDDLYQYSCWRTGRYIGIKKFGKLISNCGVKGIFVFDTEDKTLIMTSHKELYNLTNELEIKES